MEEFLVFENWDSELHIEIFFDLVQVLKSSDNVIDQIHGEMLLIDFETFKACRDFGYVSQ